jgi:hypothetical protein
MLVYEQLFTFLKRAVPLMKIIVKKNTRQQHLSQLKVSKLSYAQKQL